MPTTGSDFRKTAVPRPSRRAIGRRGKCRAVAGRSQPERNGAYFRTTGSRPQSRQTRIGIGARARARAGAGKGKVQAQDGREERLATTPPLPVRPDDPPYRRILSDGWQRVSLAVLRNGGDFDNRSRVEQRQKVKAV